MDSMLKRPKAILVAEKPSGTAGNRISRSDEPRAAHPTYGGIAVVLIFATLRPFSSGNVAADSLSSLREKALAISSLTWIRLQRIGLLHPTDESHLSSIRISSRLLRICQFLEHVGQFNLKARPTKTAGDRFCTWLRTLFAPSREAP